MFGVGLVFNAKCVKYHLKAVNIFLPEFRLQTHKSQQQLPHKTSECGNRQCMLLWILFPPLLRYYSLNWSYSYLVSCPNVTSCFCLLFVLIWMEEESCHSGVVLMLGINSNHVTAGRLLAAVPCHREVDDMVGPGQVWPLCQGDVQWPALVWASDREARPAHGDGECLLVTDSPAFDSHSLGHGRDSTMACSCLLTPHHSRLIQLSTRTLVIH